MQDMKPRRLRLVEPAFKDYTGPIGAHTFTNGVSDYPITWHEANRIGSAMRVEDADEPGYRISPAEQLVRMRHTPGDDPSVQAVGKSVVVDGEVRQVSDRYTRKELEEIADKRGLAGLRDIAGPWGVSARSIGDMIKRIIEAQGGEDKVKLSETVPTKEPEAEKEPEAQGDAE